MKSYCVLYNPLSGAGIGEGRAHKLDSILAPASIRYVSLLEIPDKKAFLASLPETETPILTGGDGTICRFINSLDGMVPDRDILYFPAGSGNDFLNDIGLDGHSEPFLLNPYLRNLPAIHFNGETHVFLNGVGYGIDGFVCEQVEKREKCGKSANYTGIAVKGLIYAYRRTRATVSVDGETHTFKNVWMTPTMNGRYFGGGMMCAPGQDRMNPERSVSLMVMCCPSKIRTLLLFPHIFKGTHVKAKRVVTVFRGHNIHVRFDRPTALQIDGEVHTGVTEYTVTTAVADGRMSGTSSRFAQEFT